MKRCSQGCCRPLGRRWVVFLGDRTGGPDRPVLAVRKVHDASPRLLANHARPFAITCGEGEADAAARSPCARCARLTFLADPDYDWGDLGIRLPK